MGRLLRANSVYPIDPNTNRAIAVAKVGKNPKGITYAFGAVWVTNADDGIVTRIKP